jgi:uncharacterized membrane protein (DUF485 family)
MAKKFNLTLICLTAFATSFMGADPPISASRMDGWNFVGGVVVAFLMPVFFAWLAERVAFVNSVFTPDLSKWSLNPLQPLRFCFFFGLLCLAISVPGIISVAVFQGPTADFAFPASFLVPGIGLTLGSVYAAWKLQDRLVQQR